MSNCLACTNASACLKGAGACVTGYVSNITSAAASVACVASTAAYCLVADPEDTSWSGTVSTTACAVCWPGYILVAANKSCVAVPTNCTNDTYTGTVSSGNWVQYTTTSSGFWSTWTAISSTSVSAAVCKYCSVNNTLVQSDLTGNTTVAPTN